MCNENEKTKCTCLVTEQQGTNSLKLVMEPISDESILPVRAFACRTKASVQRPVAGSEYEQIKS
jgi:hypothetical protein